MSDPVAGRPAAAGGPVPDDAAPGAGGARGPDGAVRRLRVVDGDPWAPLRAATPARIGLARAGDALTTRDQLALRLAHAGARDAVHEPLDGDALAAALAPRTTIAVRSACADRASYLQRPDLGRRLADGEAERLRATAGGDRCDVAFVVADGLSPRAVREHGAATVHAVATRLDGLAIGPVVVAHQARVALGDAVGEALGAALAIVLIGERPGLSTADSLGAYLTFDPRPGRHDAQRNCVSNIRPAGLPIAAAAGTVARLAREALRRQLTGVALKDDAPPALEGALADALERRSGPAAR